MEDLIREIFTPSLKEPWFFTELSFLLTFAVFLTVYTLLSSYKSGQKLLLILFSLFFYFKSSGWYILIFILVILSDFLWARLIDRDLRAGVKKLFLVCSIFFSISFLLYFKYTYFFLDSVAWFGWKLERPASLFLPIGISFYTFQSISYLVDVYRRTIPAERNPLNYFFYMTFFPHLVAGPIVRGADFLQQLTSQIEGVEYRMKEGFLRVILGLGKKLILANYLAKYVDIVNANPSGFSGLETFFSAVGYSMQIYFDFSGYSDIAIGIALMLGYELKENFSVPYTSANISEFWRKWHISLSSWLRDYVYIPFGGNRKGLVKTYLFLFLTMLIGGLWHGADWKFVLWGAMHGAALIVHKLWSRYTPARLMDKIPNWVGLLLTFSFVTFCWIFFRAASYDEALVQIKSILFRFNIQELGMFYDQRTYLAWMLLLAFFYVYFVDVRITAIINRLKNQPMLLLSLFFLLVLQLALQVKQEDVQPFIYFQF